MPDEEYLVPLGKARVVREGTDVTILAILAMVPKALAAAEALAAEGISAEVIDPRTILPLDEETLLASVAKTGRLVTVEEGRKRGGVGSEIAATVVEKAFGSLKAPIVRVAPPNIPVPPGPVAENMYLPSVEAIIQAAKGLVA